MVTFILSAFADEASPNLDAQIAALGDAGIGSIELRNVDGKSVKDLTFEEARAARKKLDVAGIRVASMGSPFGKIGIQKDFEPHMQEFLHALSLCHILGCDLMRVFSFYIPASDDPETHRAEVVRRMSLMLDAAEREGVKLAHENEKGIYGDTGDRCLILMEELGDRLGLIFDPANFIQVGESPAEQFPKLEGYLTYMHIKDALMEDKSIVPSGHGDGSIADILLAISKRSGEMLLTIEPHLTVFDGLNKLQGGTLKHRYAYPDAGAAFAAAADALKDVLKQIGYTEGAGVWTR
ncbi:MAG: sugar phosphate isomerase/epimerase family protein [Christensenellales bacterium]|jgi:sugar phosphate isomerase/epimerase